MSIEKLSIQALDRARRNGCRIATAESCTGGLIAGALTAIAGSSDAVECGFVTYSNESKTSMLDVPADLIAKKGAVSAEVARAMVEGALARSAAGVAVAVTGIAGPGGGTDDKPVGLVFVAVKRSATGPAIRECRFLDEHPDADRAEIRRLTVETALSMILEQLPL